MCGQWASLQLDLDSHFCGWHHVSDASRCLPNGILEENPVYRDGRLSISCLTCFT